MRRHDFLALCLVFVAAGALAPGATAAATTPAAIPLDLHGLPQWEVRVYDDFPVRIELADRAALASLLSAVPIADFDGEQVRLDAGGHVTLETRVTDAEAKALEARGYSLLRLEDLEQEGRRAMEAQWARQTTTGETIETALRGGYHTHAEIGALLQEEAAGHPALARLMNIGNSVQGRELWTLEISNNVGVAEPEAEVRLASTIHGNEPVGQEMLLYLVDYLLSQYGTDPVVTDLVDHTDLFITPCLNPDGLTAGTRYNANGVDLNRNFPVPDGTIGADSTWAEEPETAAVTSFATAHHFVVSENGHTGALVVNYPWDYQFPVTPDNAAVILLSLEYSTYNLPMYNGGWPQGITNGAAWYVVEGSLQDWSYQQTGCIEATIEMSDRYIPPYSELDDYWDDNRESLLHYVRAARFGIHGIVTDSFTGQPLPATVSIVDNVKSVAADPATGDYYKLLPTGTYTVVVSAGGHVSRTIPDVSTTWGTPTELNVALDLEPTAVEAVAVGRSLVCWPNPLGTGTTLHFSLAESERVRLSIYDATGRRVRSLVDEARPAGSFSVPWDGRSSTGRPVPPGIYFARLERSGRSEVTRLAVVR